MSHITDFDQHHSNGFYSGANAAFLDSRATGRIVAACTAIQALTALMIQRELDQEQTFTFSSGVAVGVLTAIGCCADLMHATMVGINPDDHGTTTFPAGSQGAELMSRTAVRAASMRRSTDMGDEA